ncbi:MAG: hypothetical protein ACJ77Z_09310 [Thermoleophilaceae bacterium]
MLRSRFALCLFLLPVLAVSACGSDSKRIDTAAYTCADFNKSLRTKSDNTAGQFINDLRNQASLGQDKTTERREITLGIYFACRGKPASTKPAKTAVATAKQIKAGKFKLPATKKSNK